MSASIPPTALSPRTFSGEGSWERRSVDKVRLSGGRRCEGGNIIGDSALEEMLGNAGDLLSAMFDLVFLTDDEV